MCRAPLQLRRRPAVQVSVDLIYGAPGETLGDWEVSLRQAIGMHPDHISAYSLIIEEGTKMGRELAAGLIASPDGDLDAQELYG